MAVYRGLSNVSTWSVALGIVVCSTSLYAQTPPAAEENDDSTTVEESEDIGETGLEEFDLSLLIDPEVRTASLVAEPLSESPAPVTVITSDMIEAIGARNLQEVLIYYVPGMTLIADKNELNVAMRGIYTDSQQKILILVDGHRINSRIFSSAAPDHSIGIHPSKVKQIEVLRGPGSAIYGNLALNGVINIVTKDAAEIDGATIEAEVGTFGQRAIHAAVGEKFTDEAELVLFADLYRAEGETIVVPPEDQYNTIDEEDETNAYLSSFRDPASYDLGARLRLGDFSLHLGARQGKMVPPFTSGSVTGGETYNYEDYRPWNGVRPGHMSRNVHMELAYDNSWFGWLSLHSGFYADTNSTIMRDVVAPRSNGADQQVSTVIGWQERTLGNLSHLTLNYDMGAVGSGAVVVGGQIDSVDLVDSYWITGSSGDLKTIEGTSEEQVLPDGGETIYSGFTQLKHALGFNGDVIFNLGVRYDYKDRVDYLYTNEFLEEEFEVGEDIRAISPRTALILAPESWFGVKFSFSDSFVDAPYFTRNNRTRNFRGTPTLLPERMRAYQLTPTIRAFNDRFRNTTNFYYLEHRDIIFRKPDAASGESVFQNSGQLVIAGVEDEITFLAEDYRIRAAASYQRPLHSEVYPVTNNEIDNVPLFYASLVLDVKPLFWMTDKLWLGLSGRYYSSQASPIDIFFLVQRGGRGTPPITREWEEPDNRVDDYFLLRASLRWKEIADTRFHADLTVDNILNQTYYQGGTTSHPYQQQGRWIMAGLGYDFDL